MRIDVLTVFPEMFESVLGSSILARAQLNGLMDIRTHNIRDYTDNKHNKTDDYPFGGGAGMVMLAQPIVDCMELVTAGRSVRRIFLSPRGRTLTTELARELASESDLALLCGHYEGIDERAMCVIDEEISVGDYILTGGELPAMVLIDCVSRFIPGVLGSDESAEDESFSDGLLEYPQYTRPALFRDVEAPKVLQNGNHAHIEAWRRQQAIEKTRAVRPELLGNFGKHPKI